MVIQLDDLFYDRMNALYEEARRKNYRISRRKFAVMCQVTAGQMNAWLNRKGEPDIQTLRRLAENCNVSISWLCGETELRRLPVSDLTEGMPRAALDELEEFINFLQFKYRYKKNNR